MKEENFPISEKSVKAFISINKTLWEEKDENNNKIVILNFSMVRMQSYWIIPKLLYAKGLAAASGSTVYVITWNTNELLEELFDSFGVEHIAIEHINNKDIASFLKAFSKVVGLFFKGRNIENLKNMTCSQIDSIGYSLYEDILRTSSLSTLKTTRNKTCLKKSLHILWTIFSLERYFKNKSVISFVADDLAYHEGALIKLFHSKGAKVLASNYRREETISFDNKGEIIRFAAIARGRVSDIFKNFDNKIDYISWVDAYLAERFKGNNGRNIDRGAFADKKVLSKEDFQKKYLIDLNKKTVVIMAHTFTDAVYNYGRYYFKDYYDWLENTLEFANQNTSVNWVLKPHPTRHAYNEDIDSIENMFERLKKPHMCILSDEISAESIKNIADVIVTIGGNAGAEFSCFGVPAVIVGKPYYQGFGYTVEPQTIEEYRNTMMNISDIAPLSDEQIDIAKKVFYIFNNLLTHREQDEKGGQYTDEFAILVNGKFNEMLEKMALNYFKSNSGTLEFNNDTLTSITSYMKSNNMKDTEYYKRGYLRGCNI